MTWSPRPLRFFPDYAADPVWDAEDGGMLSVDFLPISDELKRDIRAWGQTWTKWALHGLDEENEAEADRELEAIMPLKPLLAERLQRELGPAWSVTLGPKPF